jgi:Tol biopolymer transport system component
MAFSALGGPVEYLVRSFDQQYGLAWSPDGEQVYYCGTNGGSAMVVSVATSSARAVWSPDGRRIVGVQGDGRIGKVVVNAG